MALGLAIVGRRMTVTRRCVAPENDNTPVLDAVVYGLVLQGLMQLVVLVVTDACSVSV